MKIKSAKRIAPEPSLCIEVDSPDRLFAAGGSDGVSFLSHNSVAQRNMVFGCILRPESWRFLGIDLKRVELSGYRAYSNVVLGIATELEDAITVLRFAQQTMMKRYNELETLGLQNFIDLPSKGQALMVMVDEAGELLGSSGVKALAESTYVPNLNGRRTIAEIQPGDIVFDNYGSFTKVLDKYIPQNQEQFTLVIKNAQSVSSGRVTLETITTGADHYWVVQCPNSKHTEPHVLQTRALHAELDLTDVGKTWKIKRITKPIMGLEQELPLPPKALGLHLSGVKVLSSESLNSSAFDTDNLIPDIYLYSSRAQREALLTGIFAKSSLITDDLYLVQAIQKLVASLGYTVKLSQNGSKVTLTLNFAADEWFEIESITPIAEGSETEAMYCLRVDSPESQFLCTENFIPTHNTDEGKEQDMLKGEASMIIGSVARLGRAAGVHLIIATQRPDATLIPGETKANLGMRLNCGHTDANASSMILGSGEGYRVKSNPRGRLYLSIYGKGDHGQGFFADPGWIDEYLASKGLNPDGSPLSKKQSRLAVIKDMSAEFGEGVDLDAKEGIDNSSVIDQIRREEAAGYVEPANESDDDDLEDWGFSDAESGAAETDDEALDTSEPEQPKERADNWNGLALGGAGGSDKNHRPEDDWDDELDDLIKSNFDD